MSDTTTAAQRTSLPVAAPMTLLIAGLTLWAAGLRDIEPAAMNDLGLASVLTWRIWAAGALLTIGFCLSLRTASVGTSLPYLQLVGLTVVLHGTPAIAYETLRYSWAWKHIGIVDFIQRHGSPDPEAAFLAVYHNWPGFFLAAAWLSDLFALTPLALAGLARFFPLVLNLAYLIVVPQILRRFTTHARLVWTATCLFLLGNWIGQDYFSPQGSAYLMYLGVLALCLGPLAPTPGTRSSWISPSPALARYRSIVSRGLPSVDGTHRWGRIVASATALALILAVVVTHQLTPLLLICALAGLWAIGRLTIGYFLFAVVAELLWLFYFADPYVSLAIGEVVAEFGSVGAEALGKMVSLDTVSPGQRWVSIASRTLTGTIVVMAFAGFVRRLLEGFRDGPAVVLALAPAPLLLATSYGGEVLFRLYFYALPFLAYFAAALFFPSQTSSRPPNTLVLLCPVILALMLGFVLANNGKDRQYWFSKAEVAAAAWLYEHAEAGSLLIEGSRNYPSQFRNYENFVYVPLSEEAPDVREKILEQPEEVLGRWLSGYEHGYVMITRSQKAGVDDLGIMPTGALDKIEQALTASPSFRLIHATSDARIFVLRTTTAMTGSGEN
ncbi:hypothetical protein [Devosia nitrariae]|uniref:Glycosyltransferase RgtA/B/C/D-like domain-containing protein n=1 Tax=Devosia nitrariae TaxID=2071872 RepID=A0ABQ5W0M4_9HYPH|nr:hypothetical protein [Devosia nitrariae]GLQ53563.1 hypothetical protein GCM10010862_08220 [Devosia nitrariae]